MYSIIALECGGDEESWGGGLKNLLVHCLIGKYAAARKTRKLMFSKNQNNQHIPLPLSLPTTTGNVTIHYHCTVPMSRKRQLEEDSRPLASPSSSPNYHFTPLSSQFNSSPSKSPCYSHGSTLPPSLSSSQLYPTAMSSPIAKRVQLSRIHSEVHQKTIRMMMDALMQLQRQEQQQQHQIQNSKDSFLDEVMENGINGDDGTDNLNEKKCTYFQHPFW